MQMWLSCVLGLVLQLKPVLWTPRCPWHWIDLVMTSGHLGQQGVPRGWGLLWGNGAGGCCTEVLSGPLLDSGQQEGVGKGAGNTLYQLHTCEQS